MTNIDTNRHLNGLNAAQAGTSNGTEVAQRVGRRSEARRTADLLESLPPRIQIGVWKDGRRKAFFIRSGRDRKVESFESEQDRNDAAEKLAGLSQTQGSAILEFDPSGWREWQEFRGRCPAPLHVLESLWVANVGKQTTISGRVAVDRYLALREAEGMREGTDTHRHVKKNLGRFVAALGVLQLDQLSPDLIRDWLAKLTHPKTGAPMASVTRRHHRKDLNTFLKRCVNEEWCTRNPCTKVVPPKIEEEDKELLTPRQIFDLLKANRDQPIAGRLAFELFGGLRCSSVERLSAEHIRRDVMGVRMPGAQHKSGKTKFRQGHPAVLWAWVDHAGDAMWSAITQKNYDEQKRDAFLRAGVKNSGNVLRNSFASYMLALTKNVPLVSYLMQHRKTTTTEIYEGVAEEGDAKLVMAMTPAAVVLPWDEFLSSTKK